MAGAVSVGTSAAIITITIMVLISLHPFAFRKIFLLAVALLGFSSAFCFADSVFMARQYSFSPDQKLHAQAAVSSQENRKAPLIWASFESADAESCRVMLSNNLLEATLVGTALQTDQLLAPRSDAPFSDTLACAHSPVGLTLALPPHDDAAFRL